MTVIFAIQSLLLCVSVRNVPMLMCLEDVSSSLSYVIYLAVLEAGK